MKDISFVKKYDRNARKLDSQTVARLMTTNKTPQPIDWGHTRNDLGFALKIIPHKQIKFEATFKHFLQIKTNCWQRCCVFSR